MMGFHPRMITTTMIILLETFLLLDNAKGDASFGHNYYVTWGKDRTSILKNGKEVLLSLDQYSGAGFASKAYYGSGFFQMKIKIPNKDSAGIVTAFYLNSKVEPRDELDFEFLGNKAGKPITLQTNIFINGVGNREQRTRLWFDPRTDFHYYKLLWNKHQIAFFVDAIPIRIFKNKVNKGVEYPNKAMQVVASLWDGSDWATDGGNSKVNYSNAPFQAHFQYFDINACHSTPTTLDKDCHSSRFVWNTKKYWQLNHHQMRMYENVHKKFTTYDYCTDRNRYPIPPFECRV